MTAGVAQTDGPNLNRNTSVLYIDTVTTITNLLLLTMTLLHWSHDHLPSQMTAVQKIHQSSIAGRNVEYSGEVENCESDIW